VHRYLLRRLLQSLVVLVLVSLVGFSVLHLAPGGPAAIYAMTPTMSAEDLDRITRELGLDRPLPEQYARWAGGVLTGNWGRSYRDGRLVREVVVDRIPATMVLMLSAFTVAVAVGLFTGIVSAVRQYSLFDHLLTFGSMVALSIPTFWLGLMAIYVFAVLLGVLPPGNMSTVGADFALGDRLRHLLLPAATLGVVMVATWSRYTRAAMLEVIGEDYIRTARAKGVAAGAVILKHALKNALIPLITLAGLQLPLVFSGALVTETVFTWPGMGRLFVDSIGYRDYPVLMGLLMLAALLVVVGNLLADLVYAAVDPNGKVKAGPIVIFTSRQMSKRSEAALCARGVTVHRQAGLTVRLPAMLQRLRAEHGIRVVVCEGGAALFRSLLEGDLVDRLHLTICATIFGGRAAPTLTGLPGKFLPWTVHLRKIAQTISPDGECFLEFAVKRTAGKAKGASL
jgi:peptide/nickel transport system permease protein